MIEQEAAPGASTGGPAVPPGSEATKAVGDPAETTTPDSSYGYAVLVAQGLFGDANIRYARLFEDIELKTGACRRRVRLMWRLPTVREVAGPNGGPPDPARIVVPLTIMRRGQLYTHLKVEALNDVAVRIISRRTSTTLIRTMLDLKWTLVSDALRAAGMAVGVTETLDARIAELITSVVDDMPREARKAVLKIQLEYRQAVLNTQLSELPVAIYERFVNLAHLMGRRHVIWVELTNCVPGDVVQVEYSYATRFADEHRHVPVVRNRVARGYEAWKRWVGQPPSIITVPISRHSLARSYHVTYRVPDHNFLDRFEFVDLLPTGADPAEFEARATASGAQLNGGEDLGGSIGHLYCHEMPVGPRVAVQVKLMERPPGATASVAWLCLLSLLITVALLVNWDAIFKPDPPRLVQIALPIPGLVALWFAHVFHIDSRRRLPVAARLGLYATVTMSAFLLVLFMFAAGDPDGKPPLPMWSVIAVAAVIQGGTMCYAWYQRLHFYKRYQVHQAKTARRYGL